MKMIKALVMVLLIVLFPISVFADSLEVTQYSGENNVNGYFKSTDKWIFSIAASLDNDNIITTDQVLIESVNPQTCDDGICRYETDYYSLPDNSYVLPIKLLSDGGSEILVEEVEMNMDRFEPLIDFEPPGQRGSNVSVLFTVKDRAYDENDFTKCSGLDRIEIYDGVNLVKTITLDSSQCTYSGNEVLTDLESNRVIIKAYDRVGQIGYESSEEIEYDFTPPVINPATFKILRDGADMHDYLSSSPDIVDLSVEITEEKGLSSQNVYADFSSLGGSAQVAANSCTRDEEVYSCVWNNVQIGVTTISIPVVAEDNVGNSASATLSKTVSVDGVSPEVLSIGTDLIFGDKSYISTTANILVKISESGSGIDTSVIKIDIGSLNPSYRDLLTADECVQVGGIYNCYWYNITTTLSQGGSATIYLISLTDSAGNVAQGPRQGKITVDKQAPTVSDVKLEAVSELGVADALKSNDDLTIYATASDAGGLKAVGDFTNIRGAGYEELEAICETSAGVFTCRWDIPTVFSGYLETTIDLNFIDTAGNVNTITEDIIIYGVEDEVNPNYWSFSGVQAMPASLDRQTTSLLNQKVYFHVPLVSSQGATPLSVGLGECSGENVDFIESTDIMNNQMGSSDPYIIVTLKTTDAKIDNIKPNCTLRITSLYNNQVSNVEYESVPLLIQFYNQPLGEASEALDEKISDLREDWVEEGFWKWIGFFQIVNDYSNLACQIYYTGRSAISIFHAVTAVFGNAELVLGGTLSPAATGVKAIRTNLCLGTEAARETLQHQAENFFEKFCAFVNCKLGPLPEGEDIGKLEYWGNVLGGGGGLRNVFAENEVPWLGARWFEKYTGDQAFGPSGFMNVKDSLVLSTLTVCIPGIIYNLDKMRQINCMYIDCLESIGDSGMPPDACDDAKGYLECKYIFGEVFQFFPVFQIYDYFLGKIRTAFSSPFSLAGAVVSYVGCKDLCLVSYPTWSGCILIKIIADIGDVVANTVGIFQIFDNDWKVKEDYCENLVEEDTGNKNSQDEERKLFG